MKRLPQAGPVLFSRNQSSSQVFYGFLSLHKISVSPTPNQPGKSKLSLSTLNYLFRRCLLFLRRVDHTRYIRLTTHVRGLLYFTNYHIHDYGDFRPCNKTLDESKHHTRRVFIDQRSGAHRPGASMEQT